MPTHAAELCLWPKPARLEMLTDAWLLSEPMNCQVEARYVTHELISKNRLSRALQMLMDREN